MSNRFENHNATASIATHKPSFEGIRWKWGVFLITSLCAMLVTRNLGAVEPQPVTDVRIFTKPVHGMVAPGGRLEIHIQAIRKGNPFAGEALTLRVETDAKKIIEDVSLRLDKKGSAIYAFAPPAGASPGVWSLTVGHPATRVSHTAYLDVVDADTFQRFEQAARECIFALPSHLLFLGDSLTDVLRGRNYVDKIEFWLQAVHGPKITVKNAGVSGDFITRVWERLNKMPTAYCSEMYDHLIEPLPTNIFILLGANDCKVSSASGYTKPLVPFEEVDGYYRKVVERLRRETGAVITLISAPSFNHEIQKVAAAKMTAENKPHNLFGKPQAVEQFNTVVRKVASDLKCGWIDLYGPTESHPDKASLFLSEDGIHLTDNGNRFIALSILEALAGGHRSKTVKAQ